LKPAHPHPLLITGIVGAPFGVRGFVKVKPLSGETNHLLKLKSAVLRKDGIEKVLAIEESSVIPPVVIMRFAGYTSPEAVKALGGAELLVSRAEAAPLQPGEYYIEDLKGLTVYSAAENGGDGEILGQIAAVIEGGGGDLIEILLNDGNLKLVPFRNEFLTEIDMDNRRVTLTNLWILE